MATKGSERTVRSRPAGPSQMGELVRWAEQTNKLTT